MFCNRRLLFTIMDFIENTAKNPDKISNIAKAINFAKLWLQLLWEEDFPRDSGNRKLLNKLVSKCIELSAMPNGEAIHASTQQLINAYRSQYLQEQASQCVPDNEWNVAVDLPVIRTNLSMEERIKQKAAVRRRGWSTTMVDIFSQWQKEAQNNANKSLAELCELKEGENENEDNTNDNNNGNDEKQRHTRTKSASSGPRKQLRKSVTEGSVLKDKKATGTGKEHSIHQSKTARPLASREQDANCIAEQLTLMMFKRLKAIRPTEFLRKVFVFFEKSTLNFGWVGDGGLKNAPNVVALCELGECIVVWVKLMVISQEAQQRKAILLHMIEISMIMQKLNNQYGQLQIFGALNSPSMSKFTRVWEEIEKENPKYVEFKAQCQKLLNQSGGFRTLTNALSEMEPPAIPCLWLTLKTAFMLDEIFRKSKIGRADPKQITRLWDIFYKFDIFRKVYLF
ncbi:hypothetical protein RFI_07137 [Reticulomyxa filosa]|uniref:Ras-GEF domain-containing protein n=1 Tax=Reticulomyxa filosa TaxID=46433 RepID=X6NUK9_RETFI|nr:hypothetical protein RFI_07137 [Reticulomyxa filosa]|eukprot:ETO29985.1 hypothetical protein RFI_07137 [Reticulomyxa filosa]